MANTFDLEIITPSKRFYGGEVEHVICKTGEGYEGFLANHAWTCKLLDAGKLRFREKGAKEDVWREASAAGGFIDIKDSVIIYTDAVEWDMGHEKRKSRLAKK